jgi:hypothetical protein
MQVKLEPDMIPRTSFFVNLRSILRPGEWDTVRRAVYFKAGNRCEICGATGRLECHERWEYNESTGVQKLVALECLCHSCHEVKHMGLARVRGREREAMAHMVCVNNICLATAEQIVDEAFEVWKRRSLMKWKLDVSALESLYQAQK